MPFTGGDGPVCCIKSLNVYKPVMWLSSQEKQRMTDKLEDTSLRLKDEMDLYRKMMDKLNQNRHEYQKEKDAMQEVTQNLSLSQTQGST